MFKSMLLLVPAVAVICFAIQAHCAPITSEDNLFSSSCEPGEAVCSKCFDVLLNEILGNSRNKYNLQRAFFPPDRANPVFVRVTYYFTRNLTGDGTTNLSVTTPNQTWFWTEAAFYLFQPLQSIQYTSLLFADHFLRASNVTLYLQEDCMKADPKMLNLLTQRLKAIAAKRKEDYDLTDEYNAKGENRDSLITLHRGQNEAIYHGDSFTRYVFAFQVVFPVLVIFFLVWLSRFVVKNERATFFKELREWFETKRTTDPKDSGELLIHNPKVSRRNLSINILVVCSVTFVIYVISLDFAAIGNWNRNAIDEIFVSPTNKHEDFGDVTDVFRLQFTIPIIMLVYDFFIFVAMVTGLLLNQCYYCRRMDRCCHFGRMNWEWYHVGIAPLSCIIVHSFHILVGFIETPHHATSILIFYAITILTFYLTMKAAYYNLFQICAKCIFARENNGLLKVVVRRQGNGQEQELAVVARARDRVGNEGQFHHVVIREENDGNVQVHNAVVRCHIDGQEQELAVVACTRDHPRDIPVIAKECSGKFDVVACTRNTDHNVFVRKGNGDGAQKLNVFTRERNGTYNLQVCDGTGNAAQEKNVVIHEENNDFNVIARQENSFKCYVCCLSCCGKCIPLKFLHPCILFFLSVISFVISGIMAFVVYLFILVPIDLAIDNAPAQLFSINQTLLLFIGAAITYKLYKNDKSKNMIEYLVKANKEYLDRKANPPAAAPGPEQEKTNWEGKDKPDKELEMSVLVVEALNKMKS